MKYDKTKHLLRPLEPGEIIDEHDLVIDLGTKTQRSALRSAIGKGYDPSWHDPAFRPVPTPATGWRPRSEAHLIKEEPPFSTILWKSEYLSYGTAVSYKNDPPPIGCSHFFVIPPCDIAPPGPERTRFEAYIKNSFDSLPDKEQYAATKEAFWKVWQAAARKEAK